MSRIITFISLAVFSISCSAFANRPNEAAPEKFTYGCADRPFAHPYYGRAGLFGVCSVTVPTNHGSVVVTQKERNPEWALWLAANEVCLGMDQEILGLEYICAWEHTSSPSE